MTNMHFVPQKPFADFKWQWASFAPTESINDPVVLLGVLFRMAKLEGKCTFSSDEFSHELQDLTTDLKDSVGVNLADRGGERNIMRNSQQYWKALNLIPSNTHGKIQLTEFGRMVAHRELSQTDFSAITIMTHQLPNPSIQSEEVCKRWHDAGISIHPLKLILEIARETRYITLKELRTIVIPLSGVPQSQTKDYVDMLFDTGHLRISPDGTVELSGRARLDYGALIPPSITIPAFTNREFLRWRWENYNGI